jgi:putative ABC transport system permease protein
MSTLFFDLRQNLRALARTPSVTLLAVLMLAIGIGANTALASVIHQVLLTALPYPQPDRLVRVLPTLDRNRDNVSSFSPADFLDVEREVRGLTTVAGYFYSSLALSGDGEPEQIDAISVSPAFFHTLGVRPVLGPGVADPGAAPARGLVLLTHGFWLRRFGGAEAVLGRELTLDGRGYEVAGVLPPGFRLVGKGVPEVFLVPPEGLPVAPFPVRGEELRTLRGAHYFDVVARLAPGISFEQAHQEIAALGRRLEEAYPAENSGRGLRLSPLHQEAVREIRPALLALLGAVVLVLLIGCTNVAGLLLAKSVARQRELAVRSALGASRGRLVRQLLGEGLLLGVAGGVAGLGGGGAALTLLLRLAGERLPELAGAGLNLPVVFFACGLSLLAVLLSALLPALRSARPDLTRPLKEGAGRAGSGRGGQRLRSAFVVSQVALALVLLGGAGLLLKSFLLLSRVDPGFIPQGVLTFSVVLPEGRYPEPAAQARFFERASEELSALPGVTSAGAALTLPLSGANVQLSMNLEGRPALPGQQPAVGFNTVTPGYFEALRVPLLAGRPMGSQDHGDAPGVALVSKEFVRRFFSGEDPLGRRFTFDDDPAAADTSWVTIIGVVGDVRHTGLAEDHRPEVYIPYAQFPWRFGSFALRTAGDPLAVADAARRAILAVDPNQPVGEIRPLAALVAEDTARQRTLSLLLSVFGGVGLLLATLGLYSLVSYLVQQRTREIGIRIALGARRGQVLGAVLRSGLALAAAGVLVGTLGALAAGRTVESFLYGTAPGDPLALAAGGLLLLLSTLAAAYFPARRAASVEPTTALARE